MRRDPRVLCGMARESNRKREADLGARHWGFLGLATPSPILQVAPRYERDQFSYPACSGNAVSGAFDQLFPELPRASAVGIWREARFRMGLDLNDLEQGTQWYGVFAGLTDRGFDDWHPREDTNSVEAGKNAPPARDDIHDDMLADGRRNLLKYRELRTLDDVDDALAAGAGVVASFGVRDPFFDLPTNEIATKTHLGGDANGHALRIFGRLIVGSRSVYVIANSWGPKWGGCTVEGLALPGCFLADEDVVRNAWHCWGISRK